MASRNTALFLVGLLLSCVAMSSGARILEETAPSKGEEHLPELPALPKVELPPFPEVHLPPKRELSKVELPSFPEVELPPKPEMPTIPEFHFPKPEAKP
ncbi:protein PELPK1-like [Triticum dicoccoides]|uniref:protein PELPK1-like n=1 Tax=Triticum dicoccoides TaxID=85692 RepID=UPI00188F7DF2|nr:protein PELPK1-like [Triticum dicoccoides]